MDMPRTRQLDRLRGIIDDAAGVDDATFAGWKERARGALHAVVGSASQYLERFDRPSSAYAPVEEDATRLLAVLEAALAESDAFDESVPAPEAEPRSQQFSVDYLSRLVDAVDVFTTAFEAWMETQVESDLMSARGLFPTAWPKDGSDPADVSRRALAVAEAAGAAAKAVPVTGAYVVVQGTGLLDPVANWSHVSQPKALLSPAGSTATANQRGPR